MSVPLSHVLIVASLMFAMGLGCVVAWRANVIMMLIGIEIMLNAVMLTFVGGSAHWGIADGQLFSLMLMALTSAEVSLALAMVVYLHRRKNTVNTDQFDSMKG
ncbi:MULTISPECIES: NADH-quinone oxidoreductase subunit NuoK [Geomonas]|uniref:NADH-quinone oxidoreductase subunit K n=2 Tax=Geomonas TaxID=2651583 RepID=A0ABX8JGM1_9BACT|nr:MULTISPECIES: NADH-quinone oxidoreductase subunit NuoK [Geomonas]MBU5635407.1 NADH-quinone oxidoreductase subunit NuoK [Geomonas diazotrophica]QWV97538.1 NADH-quinone oxidoreductase subunit NuoK [Geomonas nitrogeniifigens]QXE86678.1 NADH-quinone oxidoreductase subunit NuoK [Geomonas nitrogeniifigens]QXE89886.1 NADH-quinone oxidoreductase subunit NuoK [Geomonas subterranea]QXM07996.1 NADH-quinone oxidoreductase subunit NuoK [Geomonas subterranea]